MDDASASITSRGVRLDVGGRRLRLVAAGPKGSPAVLLESGAFGFSADWAVIQERLAAAGVRSLAYDRAGLGFSDPGPEPRDGAAITVDIERLLEAAGESGPVIYCGHSMAGLFARIFVARNRRRVRGVVLVDATTPEVMDFRLAAGFVENFARMSRMAAWGADNGLLRPLTHTAVADLIGLTGEAKAEKRRAFASATHNHWAAVEVASWTATAAEARAAGPFDPSLPVAVVLAGAKSARAKWKAHLTAPADASQRGLVEHVRGATHASLLGARHAGAVVAAILTVIACAAGDRSA